VLPSSGLGGEAPRTFKIIEEALSWAADADYITGQELNVNGGYHM